MVGSTIAQLHFVFCLLNFRMIFPSLIQHQHVMFIIIVFDQVSTRSSPVSLSDFYCSLPRDQSRDVTPSLGVSVIQNCTSFRVLASFFRLLLLRLCSNRCAEALLAYTSSLLNRLNIVHGCKILTIIIIIFRMSFIKCVLALVYVSLIYVRE